MSIDIYPTAVAAAGGKMPEDRDFRRNMLPILAGKSEAPLHEALFWKVGKKSAVRYQDWKLVRDKELELYNLKTDLGESNDLAAERPEIVAKLTALHKAWQAKNQPPAAPEW